jgi:regulator of nucleoside diphosphate kinase
LFVRAAESRPLTADDGHQIDQHHDAVFWLRAAFMFDFGDESMIARTIYITEFDMKRLRALIEDAKRSDRRGNECLESLEAELTRGRLVAPTDVPADVITMNSRVRLVDLDTNEEMVYTLVFPNEANIAQSKISVLAPIGTAMLGYRVGDTFTWQVPDGIRRLQVKEIFYQPEAAGDYHL